MQGLIFQIKFLRVAVKNRCEICIKYKFKSKKTNLASEFVHYVPKVCKFSFVHTNEYVQQLKGLSHEMEGGGCYISIKSSF